MVRVRHARSAPALPRHGAGRPARGRCRSVRARLRGVERSPLRHGLRGVRVRPRARHQRRRAARCASDRRRERVPLHERADRDRAPLRVVARGAAVLRQRVDDQRRPALREVLHRLASAARARQRHRPAAADEPDLLRADRAGAVRRAALARADRLGARRNAADGELADADHRRGDAALPHLVRVRAGLGLPLRGPRRTSRGAPARPLRLRRDVRARRLHPPQLRARHRPAAGLRLAGVAALARDAGAVARALRDGPHRRDRARRADAREPGADRRPVQDRLRAFERVRRRGSAIATRPTRPTTRTRNGATRCGRSPPRRSA